MQTENLANEKINDQALLLRRHGPTADSDRRIRRRNRRHARPQLAAARPDATLVILPGVLKIVPTDRKAIADTYRNPVLPLAPGIAGFMKEHP